MQKYQDYYGQPKQSIKTWQAALYIRLSKEDMDKNKSESASISNQREILKEYLRLHPDIENVDTYVDDGFSGTDFDRPGWTRLMQPTKKFYATAKCIGCGKCERICPLRNIILTNGKPHWQHSCAHCMGCIGSCPKEAIEYGSITKYKTKYHLTKFLTEHPK